MIEIPIENPAPVLITTLNRAVHFKRCVESLALCTHADKTELYIALDYPLHDGHKTGYEEIKKYLSCIQGFKSVIVIERNRNFGAVDNLFKSVDEVFEKHSKIIISEDDNVFSKHFLEYMNNGLLKYQNDAAIYSIVGYSSPVAIPKDYPYDVYFFQSGAAWGIAFWKQKYIDVTKINKTEIKKDSHTLRKLKRTSTTGYYTLMDDLDSDKILGDTRILYLMHKHNMFAVFPIKTLVQNTGHDGSGENCGVSDVYIKNKPDPDFNPSIFPDVVIQNKDISDAIKKEKSLPRITELKIFLKRTVTKLNPLYRYSITPLKGNLLTKLLLIFYRALKNKSVLKGNSLISDRNKELNPITITQFVRPGPEIYKIFRGYNKFPFLNIFIHGSWADNTRTAFSDLDDLIIINDAKPIGLLQKTKAEYWLNKVDMRMSRIDPIQHHGHWIIYSSQLKNYDASFMPLSVLENAIRLQGPVSISGNINSELTQAGSVKNIRSCTKGTELLYKKYEENRINIFEMKGLIGNILLLPAFVNQANGNMISKRDAIISCRNIFSSEACIAIETCSTMRTNWALALESKRFKILKNIARLIRNPVFFRSVSKKYSPLFPVHKFDKLDKKHVMALVKESLNYADTKRS